MWTARKTSFTRSGSLSPRLACWSSKRRSRLSPSTSSWASERKSSLAFSIDASPAPPPARVRHGSGRPRPLRVPVSRARWREDHGSKRSAVKGLATKSLAPSARPRSTSRSVLWVEMMTRGVSLWRSDLRMNWMSSRPLMSPMLMSVTMRSYGPRGRRRIASKPLAASTTSMPPSGVANDSSSRIARTSARVEAESSTTSTLRIVGDGTSHLARGKGGRRGRLAAR